MEASGGDGRVDQVGVTGPDDEASIWMITRIGHHHRSFRDPVHWVEERWTRPACDHGGCMPLTMVAEVCQKGGAALGSIGLSKWPKVVGYSLSTPKGGS